MFLCFSKNRIFFVRSVFDNPSSTNRLANKTLVEHRKYRCFFKKNQENFPKNEGQKMLIKEVVKYDIVIITGASSGIGECFAEFVLNAFDKSKKVSKVFNISRSSTKFDSRKNFVSVKCDLSDSNALDNAVAFVKAEIAKLPKKAKILLINNSGFGAYGEFPMPNVQRNLQMIDLNVRALTAMCGAFIEDIKQSQGAIINIASTASFQPCPYLSVYAGTKSYVKSFSLALAYELGDSAKCLCVCPGPTSSMFFKAAGFDSAPLPSGFGHKPKDVVRCAFRALSKNKKIVVVGGLNTLQSIVVSLIPTRILLWLSGWILAKVRKPR